MKTKLMTAHEESYVHNDKTRIFGVLVNYSIEPSKQYKNSLIYTYKDGVYVFFNTIIDAINYMLYGENDVKRAYLKEVVFDIYYDSEFIDSEFTNKLEWLT